MFQEFLSLRNVKFGFFDDKKKELKNYFKEEKLNINKEYVLVKFVKYYNILQYLKYILFIKVLNYLMFFFVILLIVL